MNTGIVAANKPHILLVEDNFIALHLIETMVMQAGLNFTSAMDGESALALATSQQFDLIITDIGLPGISGYELTYSIRQFEKNTHKKSIPIVGLTAYSLLEIEKECLRSGINTVLSKPINLLTIQTLIKQFVICSK